MDFRKYVRDSIDSNSSIIEFGPLNRPLFNKNEFSNIYYADIRDTESIKKLYSGNEYLEKTGISVDMNSIVNIDYVIKDTYKKTFKNKKFDVAYLSHVVEHMPDIIKFFEEIANILNDNGKLILIYPDKRYCFDHYRNSASFRDAYATYKYGPKENARMAFDFGYNVVHENNPYVFWNDTNLTNIISKNELKDAEKYFTETLNGKQIDDVHFWPFSDIDFLKFIYEAQRAGLFPFEILEFYPTEENTQEFMAILKKSKKIQSNKVLELIDTYDPTIKEKNTKLLLERQQEKIDKLEKEIVEKNKETAVASNKIGQLEEQLKRSVEEYDKIINSRSWRMTKVFRQVNSLIRK